MVKTSYRGMLEIIQTHNLSAHPLATMSCLTVVGVNPFREVH